MRSKRTNRRERQEERGLRKGDEKRVRERRGGYLSLDEGEEE